jgi:hypothetical protein
MALLFFAHSIIQSDGGLWLSKRAEAGPPTLLQLSDENYPTVIPIDRAVPVGRTWVLDSARRMTRGRDGRSRLAMIGRSPRPTVVIHGVADK